MISFDGTCANIPLLLTEIHCEAVAVIGASDCKVISVTANSARSTTVRLPPVSALSAR